MEDKKDYKTLVDAVERYVQSENFPSVGTICSILGIEKKEEGR